MSIDVKGAQELLRTCERKLYEATLQLADNPHSEGSPVHKKSETLCPSNLPSHS